MSEMVKVRLEMDVAYSLNGVNKAEMQYRLKEMCQRAIGEGMLTGDTDAEVETYRISVKEVPKALSEDELADFMLQRIENSQIGLEDIPVRLARYGLMDPIDFVTEMRERMDGDEDDGDEDEVDDLYAETIVDTHPEKCDAIEIHGVRDLNEPGDPSGTCCEIDDENPEFYSVYVHLIEGGVECIGDFSDHSVALSYANNISSQHGWVVHDFVTKK